MSTDEKSFTVNSEGQFFYPYGELWEPYIDLSEFRDTPPKAADEERMIGELILNEVLFANSRPFVENPWAPKDQHRVREETLVLYVRCNDTFAYASDAECITLNELPKLYDLWAAKKHWGVIKWVALKRKTKPLSRAIERMKAAGAWDEELEALP